MGYKLTITCGNCGSLIPRKAARFTFDKKERALVARGTCPTCKKRFRATKKYGATRKPH